MVQGKKINKNNAIHIHTPTPTHTHFLSLSPSLSSHTRPNKCDCDACRQKGAERENGGRDSRASMDILRKWALKLSWGSKLSVILTYLYLRLGTEMTCTPDI